MYVFHGSKDLHHGQKAQRGMQMVTDMNAERKDGDKRTALLNGFFTTTEAADFCVALPFYLRVCKCFEGTRRTQLQDMR